jgi:SAM-dependent MidA family methyltransferase
MITPPVRPCEGVAVEAGRWRPWRTAMQAALYGEHGFYRGAGTPARHFRTAAHVSASWPRAVAELAARVDAALGHPAGFTVVDLGAGGGELLAGLADVAPERWRLVGVDVAPRPHALPDRVRWPAQPPDDVVGMVVAVEWLDVVPVDVVELTDAGPLLVEVDGTGAERLGQSPSAADAEWLDRWWPLADVGDRAEIGHSRDEAWTTTVGRLRAGAALAVDYAADPRRDVAGTLTGYFEGRQTVPVPDGRCDITAHVLMESCAAAAGDPAQLLTQRAALSALGVDATRPSYDGDPQAYLRALRAAGDAAELVDPSGLGAFSWLVHWRSVPPLLGSADEA